MYLYLLNIKLNNKENKNLKKIIKLVDKIYKIKIKLIILDKFKEDIPDYVKDFIFVYNSYKHNKDLFIIS